MVEIAWNDVQTWEVDEEAMSFSFQYERKTKGLRWVKVYTPYVSSLLYRSSFINFHF